MLSNLNLKYVTICFSLSSCYHKLTSNCLGRCFMIIIKKYIDFFTLRFKNYTCLLEKLFSFYL